MGSTTPCTKAVATAASTALPPPRRASRPASAATACGPTIIPFKRRPLVAYPGSRAPAGVDRLAADVAGIVATQKGDDVGDVDRLSPLGQRGILHCPLLA